MNSRALFTTGLVITLLAVGCDRRRDITGPSPTQLSISSISPAFAASFQPTTVDVVGTGFQSGATVTFGGQTATVLALTSTRLTVITPANVDGAVDVVVRNTDGQEARASRGFTFHSLSASSMSPGEGLPMDWVTVLGTGFQQGAQVTVAGLTATIRSVQTFEVRIVVPFCPPGPADVVVTNPDERSVTVSGGFMCQTILLTPSSLRVSPGSQFSVSWSSPREMEDWVPDEIRLCRVGANCGSPAWDTLVNARSGNIAVIAPSSPGDYEFRYFVDGAHEVSRSAAVSVR